MVQNRFKNIRIRYDRVPKKRKKNNEDKSQNANMSAILLPLVIKKHDG